MKAAHLKQILADKAAKRAVVLATWLDGGEARLIYPDAVGDEDSDVIATAAAAAAAADRSQTVDSDTGPVFLNVFNPPLRLIIVGAVHIAQPLSRMAALCGYDVTVIDPRGAFASEDRFPGVNLCDEWPDDGLSALAPDQRTAIVTLTHDPKLDDPALTVALRSSAFYIGSLGSTRTHAKRLQRLQREGFGDADFARIHGPVGLDIGAKSPAEIATAVMAQITQDLRAQAA